MIHDPLELGARILSKISSGICRRYYRFRPAVFYGGIASADCSGCNLRCLYCWSNDLAREGELGDFHSPDDVASRLIQIANSHGFTKLRITGNEPTLHPQHLIQVLEHIPPRYLFILETNGILLGSDTRFVSQLSEFENLHVRISLKGASGEEFSRITGASPHGFELQLQGIENCIRYGIACHAALMPEFSTKDSIQQLIQRLSQIHPKLAQLEFEPLIRYPHVIRRLRSAGLI